MPRLKIAGLVADIRRDNPILNRQCADYLTEEAPDFTVDFGEDYIEREIEKEIRCDLSFPPAYSEYLAIYRYLCTRFIDYDGFLMHGSALAYDQNAYLFCAPSGTGKSTHAALWREVFGERVVMINDDKPLIRKIEGVFHACGTPWSGKHDLDRNLALPLKGVVLLFRGDHARIERAAPKDLLGQLFNQIYRPSDSEKYLRTIDLVGEMLESCPVYRLFCTPTPNAARTAFQALVQPD